MKMSEMLRHQKINNLMTQPPQKIAEAAVDLWEQMAIQIISLVGEEGFNSLYSRSIFLTQSSFPWLTAATLSPQQNHRFGQLKMSLVGQTPKQASAANSLLLITFTDILAGLIGESLTTSILCLAWDNDASNSTDKEFNNEQ